MVTLFLATLTFKSTQCSRPFSAREKWGLRDEDILTLHDMDYHGDLINSAPKPSELKRTEALVGGVELITGITYMRPARQITSRVIGPAIRGSQVPRASRYSNNPEASAPKPLAGRVHLHVHEVAGHKLAAPRLWFQAPSQKVG